jgi:hypothetical protein
MDPWLNLLWLTLQIHSPAPRTAVRCTHRLEGSVIVAFLARMYCREYSLVRFDVSTENT